jgi:uncharacterized membrane protein
MSLYLLMVFLHVAAAVALLSGSVVGSPTVRAAVRRARTAAEIRAYLSIGRPLLVLEPAGAVVLLATGVYLTSMVRFWSQGWVQVSLVAWLVNAVAAAVLVKPAIARVAAEAAAADGVPSQRLHRLRWSRRWSTGGDLLLANDASILFVMILKPGLAGSLLTVAASNAVVLLGRMVVSRTRPAVPVAEGAPGEVETDLALARAPAATWSEPAP